MKRVILASASPRRKELLAQVGIDFEVIPSTGEEICNETEPAKIVETLALLKATEVAKDLSGDCDYVVIGSDTVVSKDGEVLGKPANEDHAYEMLNRLQGDIHQVYSGVALVWKEGNEEKKIHFHVKTEVDVLPMTKEQILAYIATNDPMDKAGAYGIQGCFAEYIKGIVGDYYNVVGLPLSRLMQELRPLLSCSSNFHKN